LAMAGANGNRDRENHPGGNTDDGLLTAFEVATLNLVGTDLVVLSACETGLGEITGGEGVFGLRRAFQRAGAKSVIMSMFAVPDESTTGLMGRFYKNWLAGQTKAAALRNASLSILNERRSASESAHPLFCGGFILVGDPD
jgi:CHAT domain-containing protein